MTILRNLYEFDIPQKDLVMIYAQYIWSILEYNSNVWFSNLTEEEKDDIERVQKVALKIIMKEKYISYEQALEDLNLDTLQNRRLMLAERFAKKCAKSDKFQNMFPMNQKDDLNLRDPETHNVNFASKGRLFKSAIPAMQWLLNKKYQTAQNVGQLWCNGGHDQTAKQNK